LGEECEQNRTPGPNTDKKQEANEQTEEKNDNNCTQPLTDGADTLKTPADRHLQCLEERPAPEILWSKPQKSQDSKSSGSSKSRLPTFSLMIPARSTSTPINRFKADFLNADHRQGTPRRPPRVITFKTPDNLNVEIPVINSKSKYADVKAKISTRWAPGRLKRARELEPDEKLQQPPDNLKSVEVEWPPSSKLEKAAAPIEAYVEILESAASESTEAVVDEHVPVPDVREEAKCTLLHEVEPGTSKVNPKEERMSTTKKVLLGATALGALTLGGYIIFRHWHKIVEKTSSFFNTLTIEF